MSAFISSFHQEIPSTFEGNVIYRRDVLLTLQKNLETSKHGERVLFMRNRTQIKKSFLFSNFLKLNSIFTGTFQIMK